MSNIIKFSENLNVHKLIIGNEYLKAEISTLGATLVNLRLLKTKDQRDVVWGLNSAEEYLAHDKYFGTTAGRVAGRIDKGQFTLNGETYQLAKNNNGNALHGGIEGFDKKIFDYEFIDNGIRFTYTSKDGEEGYPGTLDVIVTYKLVKDALHIDYYAIADKDTIINLTNHSYFNLEGHRSSSILNHTLQVCADELLNIDPDSCPRGSRLTLANTPFDFHKEKKIRECINGEHEQLINAKGIDHFFIFNKKENQITLKGGDGVVTLTVNTNQPGANIYSANYLDGNLVGKENRRYEEKSAICLETQNYGNDININENPTSILRKGLAYESHTEYIFKVEE